MTTSPLMLCATARLARSLQLDHSEKMRAQGHAQWPMLPALTVRQWLDEVLAQAMLAGEIALDGDTALDGDMAFNADTRLESETQPIPQGVLSNAQERLLWEEVIAEALQAEVLQSLFDIKGLALAAQEANQLLIEWRLPQPDAGYSEEVRQFLAWRRLFRARCRQRGWLDYPGYFDWQLDQLQQGAGQLPATIKLVGFDRITPQMASLHTILEQRGVSVQRHETGLAQAGVASLVHLDDQEAECRAAVAWAQDRLQQSPAAKLGIVVPELAKLRMSLARLLDDALHPAWVRPGMVEAPRSYDFSLGQPLSQEPIVSTALSLLRLLSQYQLEQQEFSALLQQPYWSNAMSEGDARARFDARLREKLPLSFSMPRLMKFMRREVADSQAPVGIKGLLAHLEAGLAVLQAQPRRQLPSLWGAVLQETLTAVNWPGQRSLSSFEYQAIQALDKVFQAVAALDALEKNMTLAEVLSRLQELSREQIYQPEAEGKVQLQVMGMLESVSQPLDAIWVMGMNDHVWPPPPRPNPLLPAAMQRERGLPNADSTVQAEFAAIVQQRLLHSARELVFSSAHKEGERELRTSPLVQGLPASPESFPLSQTLAETLAHHHARSMQWLDDHQAPPVLEGEHISGGTGLLKAQAICPAWAYFQYRLHARALKVPVNGLDAAERGTLVHAVLEQFWRNRGLQDLQAMDDNAFEAALVAAVSAGLEAYALSCDEVLSPAFRTLEAARLHRLLRGWLLFEKTREQDFEVLVSEQRQTITIEGVEITLIIDRIDQLADGSRVVMDYKTGRKPDTRNWAEQRITEPQLPVYAAFALSAADPAQENREVDNAAQNQASQGSFWDEQGVELGQKEITKEETTEVCAIAFAMVRLEEYSFAGLSRDEVLPAVPALDDKKAREHFDPGQFPDWPSVLAHWQQSLRGTVQALKRGEAAVRLQDEAELQYCEVLPLLRLPERQLQFERKEGQAQ